MGSPVCAERSVHMIDAVVQHPEQLEQLTAYLRVCPEQLGSLLDPGVGFDRTIGDCGGEHVKEAGHGRHGSPVTKATDR